MNRRTSVVDRLVALAAGALLVAGAGLTLTWIVGVESVRSFARRFDRTEFAALPDQSWWPTALGVTAVVSVLAGLTLLLLNLRRSRPETMPVIPSGPAPSGGDASLSVDPGPLAEGLAAELAGLDGVRSVRRTAVDDRGLATLRVTVVADPSIDVADFTRSAEAFARSMATALPGAPVAAQVLLHLSPAEQSTTTAAEQGPSSPSTAD
ncbi:hypothetical protein [Rhodococcus gannanensis]|uniref:Alkaline shock response membrane anchor protein AmaP n=1 Tax=Rhodococcus gannanensis TaxID=1960308 RepID=A0ABW4P8Q4_9NOCA